MSKFFRFSLPHLATLFIIAPLSIAFADSAPAGEVVELDKVEVSGTSDAIVTQALGTKSSLSLIETPQSVSVVTRNELDLRNVKTVGEALRYTAGASTAYYGEDPRGYNWVKIRGFSTFDSEYLDGIRLFNYELTEAFGLERVEIMKGPSSVLYGQSTPGGLINSVSRRPVASPLSEFTAEIGTGQSYEATLDVGGKANTSGTALYRLTTLFRDNEKDSNGYEVNARRTYLAPALTWRLSDADTLTLLSSYTYGESVQTPSLAAAEDGSATEVYINNKNWDLEENTVYRIGYQFEHRINSNLVFRQNARVSRYEVTDKYLNTGGYSVPNLLNRVAALFESVSRTAAIDSHVELKTSGTHLDQTLMGGFDYAFSSFESLYREDGAPGLDLLHPDYNAAIPLPTNLYTDSDQRNTQAGIYLQDQLKFNSYWIATLSGRYDWASSKLKDHLMDDSQTRQDDRAFSGRAGFAYLAANGLAPYVSYSTSFYPNSGVDFSNQAFDPTKGRQYEVGLKYAPAGDHTSATLSLYDLTQTNVLTSDPANPGFSRAAGEWRSRGIELETRYAFTTSLDVMASASYDDIEITKSNDGYAGNVPYLTPKLSASTW
jgi:iron complex outermembrane recepter protein